MPKHQSSILPNSVVSIDPAQLFNLLSDKTRLRCLALIQQEHELCVCELMYALNAVQPKISRHLALLRKYNLVIDRRNGLWIYYRLHPQLPKWGLEIINKTFDAIYLTKPYVSDKARLAKMPNRPSVCAITVSSSKTKKCC